MVANDDLGHLTLLSALSGAIAGKPVPTGKLVRALALLDIYPRKNRDCPPHEVINSFE